MKTTITARPVLVESKEYSDIIYVAEINKLMQRSKLEGNVDLLNNLGVDKQLILISDEKIKDGDLMMDLRSLHYGRIVKCIGNSTSKEYEHWYKGEDNVILSPAQCAKVIALQSQLSHEYIQQAISEYNNGGMKDVEIEMEYITTNEDWSKTPVQLDGYYQPKLTNGFITIVKEEPVHYTDADIITFLQQYRYDLASGKTPMIGDTTKDWFNNNKKK